MPTKKYKVLIIDDEELLRETVKLALVDADFEAVALESPKLAQTVVKQSRPDLILLDIYMPEIDGFSLCRALQADPETKKIPIIILTGSNQTVDVVAGIQAGAYEYLTKPIDGRILVEKIQKILRLPRDAAE